MNKDNWYLASKDKWLYGKQAFDYVSDKLNNSKEFMEDISKSIEEVNRLIITNEDSTNIYDEYLNLEEKISLIEISLQMILETIRRHNNND